MSVTVRELLKLPSLKGAKVLGGRQHYPDGGAFVSPQEYGKVPNPAHL